MIKRYARAAGLDARGLSFPGHFVVQLDRTGERLILDPFNGGVALAADDLRGMLKVTQGTDAELTPDHYRAVTDVEVLLRLENNIKLRLVQQDRSADVAASRLGADPCEGRAVSIRRRRER